MAVVDGELLVLVNTVVDMIDDPEVLTQLAKKCWENARMRTISQLKRDLEVEFTDKTGRVVHGFVHRVLDKNIEIVTKRGNIDEKYTVSPSLIRVVHRESPR